MLTEDAASGELVGGYCIAVTSCDSSEAIFRLTVLAIGRWPTQIRKATGFFRRPPMGSATNNRPGFENPRSHPGWK
jgi:hypothetical protein